MRAGRSITGVVWGHVLDAGKSQGKGALTGPGHQGWPYESGVQGLCLRGRAGFRVIYLQDRRFTPNGWLITENVHGPQW